MEVVARGTRRMKDSGIEWIGEIPEDWELVRFSNCIVDRCGGAWGEDKVGDENDCICLRIADFDYSKFKFVDSDNYTVRNYTERVVEKLQLVKGDILIEKSGGGEKTPVGRSVVFDKDIKAVYANFMDRIRCTEEVIPWFLQYIFATFYYNEYTRNYINQTTGIQNLDLSSMLKNEYLPLPQLNIQQRIVTYLDSKCSKIDFIIEKQEAVIEKLQAYKQSLITEKISCGIFKANNLINTSVGFIPDYYKIYKMGDVISVLTDYHANGSYEVLSANVTLLDEQDYALMVRTTNLEKNDFSDNVVYIDRHAYEFLSKSKVYGDEIIINKIGSAGKVYYMPNLNRPVSLAMNQFLLRFKEGFYSKYIYYYLKSKYAEEKIADKVQGAVTKTITKAAVKSIPFYAPDLEEQQQIADFLDSKCSSIDASISKKKLLIEKLKAYKKSLIYEVVTGKKEVN